MSIDLAGVAYTDPVNPTVFTGTPYWNLNLSLGGMVVKIAKALGWVTLGVGREGGGGGKDIMWWGRGVFWSHRPRGL